MTTRFRNSFTHKAGLDSADVIECKVVNVNAKAWTVDVRSTYDRKTYLGIQVLSPYAHYSNGEGIYCMPEIGAKCMVCLTSDSSAPCVLGFVMPHQTSTEGQSSSVNFDGGRPTSKPGDIVLRTRDNNFVILHRGGVLQIGASELSQRIFIPLGNLMMDISERYEHHNAAGSIVWGLQDGPKLQNFPATYRQTFRVFANDDFADVRLTVGSIEHPFPEPPGDKGDQSLLDQLEIGTNKDLPTIAEVVVAKKGFNATSGAPADNVVLALKFAFDRGGGVHMKCAGSVLLTSKKDLYFKADGAITLDAKKGVFLKGEGATLDGGPLTEIKGDLVRLGAGTTPVARSGDLVKILVVPGSLAGATPSVAAGVLWGTISTSNPGVLA